MLFGYHVGYEDAMGKRLTTRWKRARTSVGGFGSNIFRAVQRNRFTFKLRQMYYE